MLLTYNLKLATCLAKKAINALKTRRDALK
jgi:hypothetical protein